MTAASFSKSGHSGDRQDSCIRVSWFNREGQDFSFSWRCHSYTRSKLWNLMRACLCVSLIQLMMHRAVPVVYLGLYIDLFCFVFLSDTRVYLVSLIIFLFTSSFEFMFIPSSNVYQFVFVSNIIVDLWVRAPHVYIYSLFFS